VAISIEEFYKLRRAESDTKPRKIDWDKVLADIIGKPVRVADIMEVAKKHRLNKEAKFKLYYSEVTRFLSKLKKDSSLKVEKRKRDDDGAVFWLILRREK